MSIEVHPYESPSPAEGYEAYRALSSAAVASVLLALLGGLTLLTPWLGIIPLLGVLSGMLALRQIRLRASELAGRGLAWAGIGLSLVCLAAGWSYATYDYLTKVPPGYTEISYAQLQPEEGVRGQVVPPLAKELEGKRVFIEGYVFPGSSKTRGIKQFLLVRDRGTCCFGGNPKITDRVQVTLKDPLSLTFNTGVNRVGCIFHISPANNAIDAGGDVYYHLDADYLQ
ncbi:MAG: DUF3299 domain-containing protein [Planctomycetia bacterium]|nr:DUF3299 domain-containing protein [Planctomycetia bacterium]